MLDTYGYKHTQPYAIIIAFLLQQWLHERALMLHYTYTASLVHCCDDHPNNIPCTTDSECYRVVLKILTPDGSDKQHM